MSEQDFENEILVEDTDRSVSQAEDKFRAVVRQALVDASAIGDPDQLDDYADAVVGSLKLDNWLIQAENVYSIRWAQPVNWDDDYSAWRINTDGLDGYQSVWGSWEDDEDE